MPGESGYDWSRSDPLNNRVEINTDVMQGKPVIRGTRIPVELLLRKMAEGATTADLDRCLSPVGTG